MKTVLTILLFVVSAQAQTDIDVNSFVEINKGTITYHFTDGILEKIRSIGGTATWIDTFDIVEKVVWPDSIDLSREGVYFFIPVDTSVVPDTVFASRFDEGDTKRLRLRYTKKKNGDYEKTVDGVRRLGKKINDPFEDLIKQDKKNKHKTKKERKKKKRRKARRIR